MILLNGIDIVKISRFEKIVTNNKLMKKLFSPSEITFFNSKKKPVQNAAASFAAKEAFSKALGTGIREFNLTDISVRHNSLGKPYFEFSETLKEIIKKMGYESFELSISHEKEYAVASVIAAGHTISQNERAYNECIKKFNGNYNIQCEIITPLKIKSVITKRAENMHKGDAGRLVIIAGSKGLTGAALLSSKASLKCGAGLITLVCCESLNNIFETALPEVMTLPCRDTNGILNLDDIEKIFEKCQNCSALLIGPGMGVTKDTQKILEYAVKNVCAPIIIDADGINALSKNINILSGHKMPIIITPHIGEFARLTGLTANEILSDTAKYASKFAQKYDVTVILKSHRTVVAHKGKVYSNILGNPGMATGGSGDVLSGCVASFAAQFKNAENAALAGVFIHSLSADMASCLIGEYGLTPTDICNFLPYAIKYSQ